MRRDDRSDGKLKFGLGRKDVMAIEAVDIQLRFIRKLKQLSIEDVPSWLLAAANR